jgi:hypothetical protein
MAFFLAQMTESPHIAMAVLIVDFQGLYHAHSGGGFFRLITEL